jgi:NAD-dependent SIR2 family protein deacetylase
MKDLIEKIRNRQVILFVGAGVSATIGLPTWSQLMDYVADSLGIDSSIFKL